MRLCAVTRAVPVLLGAALLLSGGPVAGEAADETEGSAPPGSITFVGKNLVASANGSFTRWRVVAATLDRARPEGSVVEVEIDVASLDTGSGRRDRHLRTADFFDVERYPTARARARDPRPTGTSDAGNPLYRVDLDLDIHGVQKTVEAMVELTGTDPIAIDGRVVLDRNDFAIGDPHRRFNPMSIRNEVPVHFSATLTDTGA